MSLKAYLITDSSFYTHDLAIFKNKLKISFKKFQPEFALYRDKNFNNYEKFAPYFVQICKKNGVKAMLHNCYDLSCKLDAYGVHYSSDKFYNINKKNTLLFNIASTHTQNEIELALQVGIDAVTFSPIFTTPNKGAPQGLHKLKKIIKSYSLPIIALGGIIRYEQVKEVQKVGAWGFASIRYFCQYN